MALEITVLQGVDVFAQMFNAVAAFVRNETWHSLMIIAEIIGVVACMVVYIKKRDLKVMGLWLLSFVLINTLLLTPKERLVIQELQTSKIRTVDNVPLGVALPIYFTTLVGNAIARSYDTLLAQPEDIQYSKTGLLFGQRLMDHSMDIVPNEPHIASNLNNYMKFCLIERNVISKEFAWTALLQSSDLKEYLQKGKAGDMINYTNDRGEVSSKNCEEAGKQIQNDITSSMNASRKGVAWDFARKLGIDGMLNGLTIPQLNSKMAAVQNYFMGTSKSASDIYVQNMLVNQFRKSIDSYPTQLDASAVLISQTAEQSLTKMKLSHLSSYQVSGRLLPALHTTLLALMVGLFPIMVLAMFIRELAWGVVKNYLAVLFSLMMWPVMFAIFNSIMNTLLYQTLNGQSFTLSNANTLKENASTMAGVAMWLTASIPFLSFRLVTALGQSIANAGSYLGNSMIGATTADAAQTAQGNYNWGNMSTNNVNGNKVDLNHTYFSGQSRTQNSDGSITTVNANGALAHDVASAKSNLAFSVTGRSSVSGSTSERIQTTMEQAARNQSGVRQFVDSANSMVSSMSSGLTTQTQNGKITTTSNGYDNRQVIGKNENVDNSESATNRDSNSKQDQDSGATQVTAGLSGFGNSMGATTSNASSDNAVSQKDVDDVKRIQDSFNKGSSLAKIDGEMTQFINGTTNVALKQQMQVAQAELRKGISKYNEFVESNAKIITETQDTVISRMSESSVVTDRTSAVVDYLYKHYSEEDRMKALAVNPDSQGLQIRNEAIQAVDLAYENAIINEHLQQKGILQQEYANKPIGMPTNNMAGNLGYGGNAQPTQLGNPSTNSGKLVVNPNEKGGKDYNAMWTQQNAAYNAAKANAQSKVASQRKQIEQDNAQVKGSGDAVKTGAKETSNYIKGRLGEHFNGGYFNGY